MNWKSTPIQQHFEKQLAARALSDKSCLGADYCDREEILFILLRNYAETVTFLTNSTILEIACAVDVLENLVEALPKEQAQTILNIFKRKLREFPNVQSYAATEYVLELQLAQDIIDGKD